MREYLDKNEDEQRSNEDEYTPGRCYCASTEQVPATGEKAGNAEEYGQNVTEGGDHPGMSCAPGSPSSPKQGGLSHTSTWVWASLEEGLPCDGRDSAADQGKSYGDEQYDPGIARQSVCSTLPACRCC